MEWAKPVANQQFPGFVKNLHALPTFTSEFYISNWKIIQITMEKEWKHIQKKYEINEYSVGDDMMLHFCIC